MVWTLLAEGRRRMSGSGHQSHCEGGKASFTPLVTVGQETGGEAAPGACIMRVNAASRVEPNCGLRI